MVMVGAKIRARTIELQNMAAARFNKAKADAAAKAAIPTESKEVDSAILNTLHEGGEKTVEDSQGGHG